jgi:hypothetical protein
MRAKELHAMAGPDFSQIEVASKKTKESQRATDNNLER